MLNIIMPLVCIALILSISVILSDDRANINNRTVVVGISLLFAIVLFVLKTKIGSSLLEGIALGVQHVANYGIEGLVFVFGDLSSNMFVFAISVLGLLVFLSALIELLHYLGVIRFFVKHLGGLLSKLMGTTDAETMNAVGNIVLGQTESPLLIKPYLSRLTESELFAIMVSGMGSASASILVGYNLMGIPMKYLLVALFTVPFSTLVVAKIIKPSPKNNEVYDVEVAKSSASNLFDAISVGTGNGLNMALNVGASLISFIGMIALVNGVLGIFNTNLSSIFGLLFTPIAWLFNIPSNEVSIFGGLLGTKLSVNEFLAFTDMSLVLNTLSPRTVAILSVALCNFANFSSIAIQLGGLSSIEPTLRGKVAKLGIKALIAATLSTLLASAIVGLLF